MTAPVGSPPEEFVEPCAVGAEWNETAPRPTLLLLETRLVAVVRLAEPESESSAPPETRATDRAAYGLIVFDRCQAFTFGPPGDTELANHRFFARGLEASAAHTVPRSSWAVELGAPDLTHFVLTFSSGTLECLARSVSSGRRVATLEEVLAHIGSWLS